PPIELCRGTIGWGMNSKPVDSRIVRSMSRVVQRKTGVTSGIMRRSDCATEMPGYKCPPVPPPARTMVGPLPRCDGSEGEDIGTRCVLAFAGKFPPHRIGHELRLQRRRGLWLPVRL